MSLPKRLAPAIKGGLRPTSFVAPDGRADAFALAPPDSTRREDYAAHIGALWQRARESFVAIGLALAQAKARLAHGEFERMIESDLPFDKGVAHQIRAAAEAVQSGRLPRERVPANYTTVYHLATLTTEELAVAERENLLRPDVRRSEVLSFKARMRRSNSADAEQMRRSYAKALRQRAELDKEIAALEDKLRALGVPLEIEGVAEKV